MIRVAANAQAQEKPSSRHARRGDDAHDESQVQAKQVGVRGGTDRFIRKRGVGGKTVLHTCLRSIKEGSGCGDDGRLLNLAGRQQGTWREERCRNERRA